MRFLIILIYIFSISVSANNDPSSCNAIELLAQAPKSSTRFNFQGRQDFQDITNDLGQARKKLLLDTYNPENKYELSRLDEAYFSGIADMLDYRLRQDFPDLSENLIRDRVTKDLDEIIESCKGN